MPRIPLANIPQAPGTGPGPAMIQTPGFRVNTAGLANQMMQSGQSAAPYVAAAGMDALADGVAGAGNVFGQLSAEMARSKNVADIARADVLMAEAKAAHAEEIATLPESEWGKVWETKYRPQYEKGVESLNLSTWSRERVVPMMMHFDSRVRTDTAYAAHKQTLERDQQAILNSQQRDMQDGDFDGAMGKTALLIESGHMTPEQGEKLNLSIREDQMREVEQAQRENVLAVIQEDPWTAAEELEKAAAGEETPFGKMKVERARSLLAGARRERKFRTAELRGEIHNAILSGEVETPEAVRQMAGDRLDERTIKSLDAVITSDPEFDPAAVLAIRTGIAEYDGSLDADGALEQYAELAAGIETTVPKNLQGPLRQALSQAFASTVRDGKKPAEAERIKSAFYRTAQDMASRGLLTGTEYVAEPTSTDTSKKAQEAREKAGQIRHKNSMEALRIQDAIDEAFRAKPDMSREEAEKMFESLVGKGGVGTAKAVMDAHGVLDTIDFGSDSAWVKPSTMGALLIDPRKFTKKGRASIADLTSEVEQDITLPEK
jgi:transposase